MKHVKFTYVDSVTGVSVEKEPATNGPVYPPIPELEFVWARESQYPTDIPQFFGTCPDESDIELDGVMGVFVKEDWDNMHADEVLARKPPVPQVVDMAQCRLALYDLHGIGDDEEFYALVNILPKDDQVRARIELGTRRTVEFNNPLVQAICAANGWDAAELFTYAAVL